jgi:poly(beta-D-mannuronate) lyase
MIARNHKIGAVTYKLSARSAKNRRCPVLRKILCIVTAISCCLTQADAYASKNVLVTTNRQALEALAAASPGDTITLASGLWKDLNVTLRVHGTDHQPIVLKAQTPGKVIVTGKSAVNFASSYWIMEGIAFLGISGKEHIWNIMGHHNRITNSTIERAANPKWVFIYGDAKFNRIDHCRFAHKQSKDVMINIRAGIEPSYNIFDHNYLYDRPKGTGNNYETVRLGLGIDKSNSSHTLIEANLFEECSGEAEIISVKCCDNIIRNNTFKRCNGEVVARQARRLRIENNYFLGEGVKGAKGVRLNGDSIMVINNYFSGLERGIYLNNGQGEIYRQLTNGLIAFNTIVDCRVSLGIGGKKGKEPPSNCILKNNIAIASRGDTLTEVFTVPEKMTYAGNYFFGDSPVGIKDPGFITVDPHLIKNAHGIFVPSAASPLVETDKVTENIQTDMSGQTRNIKTNAGALCYSARVSTIGPLTPHDVGISYMIDDVSMLH